MKLLVFSLVLLSSLYAEVYTVYTEELPPYNFSRDGKVEGRTTELLQKVLKQNGDAIQGKIHMGPWAKGYHAVLSTKNSILYSTARTKDRESLFKWVGPIDTVTIGLVAKKSRHITIKDAASLHYYKIAAPYETAAERLLLGLGFKAEELDQFTDIYVQMRKLQEERVDAVAYGIEAIHALLLEAGLDPYEYETIYVLKKSELYFAFNKDTPSSQIVALNQILKTLKVEKK